MSYVPPVVYVEEPEFRTVRSFQLERLHEYPSLTCTVTETVRDKKTGVVEGADLIQPSEFNNLVVRTAGREFFFPGMELIDEQGNILGTIAQSELIPEKGVDPAAAVESLHLIVLEEPVLTDPTGLTVQWHRRNCFGAPIHRRARGGVEWEMTLYSSVPEHLARMNQMLGAVTFRLLKAAFLTAGLEKTDQEIMQLVQQLAAQDVTLDSCVVAEIEQIDREREAGTLQIPFYERR